MKQIRVSNLKYFILLIVAIILIYYTIGYSWLLSTILTVLVIIFLWKLISPSVYIIPSHRHNIVSLDISGNSKSIRFVRNEAGKYIVSIFTPIYLREVEKRSKNKTATRLEGGGIKVGWEMSDVPTYTTTGQHHTTVLQLPEMSEAKAVTLYLCLLLRAEKQTIFDTQETNAFLNWAYKNTKILTVLVGIIIWLFTSVSIGFIVARSSPTLPKTPPPPKNEQKTLIEDEKR